LYDLEEEEGTGEGAGEGHEEHRGTSFMSLSKWKATKGGRRSLFVFPDTRQGDVMAVANVMH
jgi:hypothetical protein